MHCDSCSPRRGVSILASISNLLLSIFDVVLVGFFAYHRASYFSTILQTPYHTPYNLVGLLPYRLRSMLVGAMFLSCIVIFSSSLRCVLYHFYLHIITSYCTLLKGVLSFPAQRYVLGSSLGQPVLLPSARFAPLVVPPISVSR